MKIKLPSVPKVAPSEGPLHFGSEERPFFDGIATEQVAIGGTEIDYYSLDPDGSDKDPVYSEPLNRKFKGPFRIWGIVSEPESTPDVRDEGTRTTWDASVWIARKALDDAGCPTPNEGDVLAIWPSPFWKNWAGGTENSTVPGAMYAFDCVNVNDDAHMFDNGAFLGFKIDLKRRSQFTPERRIDTAE